ncbi:gliding motility protein [Flavobacterium sp. MAH-1]|uniref:Gliding motility protein n=1 Tax=Flavobacterium agri TaxID=2743471 RepID=A0A7Y8Y095_9FLAO|nr:gliding motility protein [Flavobacterium agri]NYA70184.1 gliding motility protein [Flavobacterium agri]
MHKTVTVLKTNIFRIVSIFGFIALLVACSTKRDTFLARNSHALSTKYNILYNGDMALEAGMTDLRTTYGDNFWEILPVERMQPEVEQPTMGGQPTGPKDQQKNPNFQRAEEKATKAIQKHSMNIGGTEVNYQIDEAHILLGKARYYDKRYIPALEAFNYVLYKYPKSSRIYEAKVWREKTNMRLENDQLAITNLSKLLADEKVKLDRQVYSDANATLAQAFINTKQKDSAVSRLKIALKNTRHDEEEARYRFIIGQLFDEAGQKDSAWTYYQQVIDMKRSSPRMYTLQAHGRQAAQFDYEKGDTLSFIEKYNKLLKDRENRPYLDVLNHQMALFYDKRKKPEQALKYYNKSLDAEPKDAYLNASNYRNMAEIYFNEAKYVTAGMYYDSTLVHLKPRTREYRLIEKKRMNLDDVIKYEGIAQTNDSIINVYSMSKEGQIAYYQAYIDKLKKQDEAKRIAAEKEKEKAEALAQASGNDVASNDSDVKGASRKSSAIAAQKDNAANAGQTTTQAPKNSKPGDFYFYNSTTVAFGKSEFRKNWGNRTYQENWRFSKPSNADKPEEKDESEMTEEEKQAQRIAEQQAEAKYTTDFYISQLPTSKTVIDSLAKERNFAYYQLGVIYKEKFKEYQRAADKLEKLLMNSPEERLILPAQYNLYKIYEIIDKDKAAVIKQDIISQYPDSRYAQILSNAEMTGDAALTPTASFNKLYKLYQDGEYKEVMTKIEEAIDQYTGEEMLPKFEMLKARNIGKLKGLEEYKKALNYVALTYPNQAEGKEAETLLGRDVVMMENLQFNEKEPKSWKILYRAPDPQAKNIKSLQEKLKKFISERTADQLTQSLDIYTMDMNFVVLHGIKTEQGAEGIASVLKEFKEYKVPDAPIVISSDNYGIVQIKKNLEEYLADPHKPAEKRAAPALKPVDEPKKNQTPRGARIPKQRPAQTQQQGNQPPTIGRPPQDSDDPKQNNMPPGMNSTNPKATTQQPTQQQPRK